MSLLSVGEGHQRFGIARRGGSPIRSIQDLEGKTVGAVLEVSKYLVDIEAIDRRDRFDARRGNPECPAVLRGTRPEAAGPGTGRVDHRIPTARRLRSSP